MKLIIEIPEEKIVIDAYEEIISNGYSRENKLVKLANYIFNGTPLNEYIDKAFDDLNKCQCGSSYIIIDGETYRIDTGYAFEGIELFIDYLKKRGGKK